MNSKLFDNDLSEIYFDDEDYQDLFGELNTEEIDLFKLEWLKSPKNDEVRFIFESEDGEILDIGFSYVPPDVFDPLDLIQHVVIDTQLYLDFETVYALYCADPGVIQRFWVESEIAVDVIPVSKEFVDREKLFSLSPINNKTTYTPPTPLKKSFLT